MEQHLALSIVSIYATRKPKFRSRHQAATTFVHTTHTLIFTALRLSLITASQIQRPTTPSTMKSSTMTLWLLAAVANSKPITRRQLGSSTSSELEDGSCGDVIFIFARGSTETGNMVSNLHLSQLMPQSLTVTSGLYRRPTNLLRP